jgi:hypothetical protein
MFESGVLQTTRFGLNLFSLTQLLSAKLWWDALHSLRVHVSCLSRSRTS